MNLSKKLLEWAGWKINITAPDYDKCIICVAPHTSNWDFILGKLAYSAVGRKAGFLMKESWFFFPLGCIFKAIGGIPVIRREHKGSLTEALTEQFIRSRKMSVAITPEGTRSRNSEWHQGFLRIAYNAHIPIVLGVIDGGTKTIIIRETFTPTGNFDADMRAIKDYYSQFTALYPEKFSTD